MNNLFQAQKQIFNLMKFDSYSRFLKSELYQECLDREARGDELLFSTDETLDPDLRIHPHTSNSTSTAADQHNNNVSTYTDVSGVAIEGNAAIKGAWGDSEMSNSKITKDVDASAVLIDKHDSSDLHLVPSEDKLLHISNVTLGKDYNTKELRTRESNIVNSQNILANSGLNNIDHNKDALDTKEGPSSRIAGRRDSSTIIETKPIKNSIQRVSSVTSSSSSMEKRGSLEEGYCKRCSRPTSVILNNDHNVSRKESLRGSEKCKLKEKDKFTVSNDTVRQDSGESKNISKDHNTEASHSSNESKYNSVRRRKNKGRQGKKDCIEESKFVMNVSSESKSKYPWTNSSEFSSYVDNVFDGAITVDKSKLLFDGEDINCESNDLNSSISDKLDSDLTTSSRSAVDISDKISTVKESPKYDSLGLTIPDEETDLKLLKSNEHFNLQKKFLNLPPELNNELQQQYSSDSLSVHSNASSLKGSSPIKRLIASFKKDRNNGKLFVESSGGGHSGSVTNTPLLGARHEMIRRDWDSQQFDRLRLSWNGDQTADSISRVPSNVSIDATQAPHPNKFQVLGLTRQKTSPQFSVKKKSSTPSGVARSNSSKSAEYRSNNNNAHDFESKPQPSSECPYLKNMKREKSFVKPNHTYDLGDMPDCLK